MRALKTHGNTRNSRTSIHPSIYLFIQSLNMHFVDIFSFFPSLSLHFVCACFSFLFVCIFYPSRCFFFLLLSNGFSPPAAPTSLIHRLSSTDKWYSSILHTKPRASHPSWWYGIQNGLIIIINRLRINTNHLYIHIGSNAEHLLADLSSNPIISFNVIFSLLLNLIKNNTTQPRKKNKFIYWFRRNETYRERTELMS